MKVSILALLAAWICVGCKPDAPEKAYYYKATNQEGVALLALTIQENHFFGRYEVRYGGSGKETGNVQGDVFGDTLKGRYNYLSFGGNRKIAPFVLLKQGEILKMGSGTIATYLNIPFFIPETFEFKDSDFQFHRIDSDAAKNLGLVTQ